MRRIEMETIIGKYQHYKGNYYEVLGIAKHSETLEEFVVYRALYDDYQLWIRPLEMFLGMVEVEGREVPRFRLIEGSEEKFPVYLDISADISDLLSHKSITLEDFLQQAIKESPISFGPLLLSGDEKNRSKDIVPIIIVSSIGLSAILLSLSSLLESYFHRPHYYEWDELEELREKGKIIKDKKGNPIWKTRRHHKVVFTSQRKEKNSIDFETGLKGIILHITSDKE